MERTIAWLMTVVAAAGVTAYADGLEKPGKPVATVSVPAGNAGSPATEDGPQETPGSAP